MVPKSTLLETVVKVLKISTEIYGQSVLERPIYKVNILELRKEKVESMLMSFLNENSSKTIITKFDGLRKA